MLDTHVHTSMSPDSKQDPFALVEYAIGKGLRYLAITDHQENEFPESKWRVDFAKQREIVSQIRSRYGDRITVAYGIEMSYAPHDLAVGAAQIKAEPFDTVINSLHNVNGQDCYRHETCAGKTKQQAYGEYLAEVEASLDVPYWYSQVGHIGYIARYGHYEDAPIRYREFSEQFDRILKKIVEREVLLEVNTSRGNTPAPDFDVLTRYYELGGRLVTLGSDAHTATDLAVAFVPTARRLADIGFTEIGYYLERKLHTVPIASMW